MKLLQTTMRWRSRLAFVALLVITGISGAVAGIAGNRWGVPVDLAAAGERIGDFPDEIGDWQVERAAEFEGPVREVLQCSGSTTRSYRHRQTGDIVNVALQVGPPGPTAVHTPDVCFASQAYAPQGRPKPMRLDRSRDASDTFWEQTFQAKNLDGEMLNVAYAWSDGEEWIAAERPRFEFAGRSLLYKLQVVAHSGAGEGKEEARRRLRQFLETLLPLLDADVLVREEPRF